MFPNASCELNYKNHFELLVAVVLSAQTTDKRVNIVTKELFEKYPTPLLLSSAKYDDLLTISGWVSEIKGVRVTIRCEVRRGDELLVAGHTVHACIDMKTGRPCRVPKDLHFMVESH